MHLVSGELSDNPISSQVYDAHEICIQNFIMLKFSSSCDFCIARSKLYTAYISGMPETEAAAKTKCRQYDCVGPYNQFLYSSLYVLEKHFRDICFFSFKNIKFNYYKLEFQRSAASYHTVRLLQIQTKRNDMNRLRSAFSVGLAWCAFKESKLNIN